MKTSNKILLALIFIALGLLGFAYFSFATTIVQQTLSGTSAGTSNNSTNYVDQGLGTELTGDFKGVYFKATAGSTGNARLSLYECTTSVRTSCTGAVWTSGDIVIHDTGLHDYYASSSAPNYTLISSKYYYLDFYPTTANTISPSGTTSNNYANGACTRLSGGSWGTCSNSVLDLYFIVDGIVGGIDTRTHIDWINPVDGDKTASRSIDFNLKYYFNTTTHDETIYNQILILACSLIDVTPYNQNLNDCEQLNFEPEILNYDTLIDETVTFTLNTDGAYLLIAEYWNGVVEETNCAWLDFFCETERPLFLAGNAININVATESISWEAINDAVGKDAVSVLCGAGDAPWYDVADLTAGYICKVMVFLFYPASTIGGQNTQLNDTWTNLGDKLPFALYFAPYNTFYSMSETTASNSFGTFTMPIMGLATLSFDFKSFKDNNGDFLDSLSEYINYFLWFWFALYIFKDLTSKKDK